jgi:hypothetical protein
LKSAVPVAPPPRALPKDGAAPSASAPSGKPLARQRVAEVVSEDKNVSGGEEDGDQTVEEDEDETGKEEEQGSGEGGEGGAGSSSKDGDGDEDGSSDENGGKMDIIAEESGLASMSNTIEVPSGM